MTHHQVGQLLAVVHLADLHGGGQPAQAQHGAAVADFHDLVELVADEDHGVPLAGQHVHHVKKSVHLVRRQHGGGLIQDQQLGVPVQSLQNLQTLLLAHRQLLHPHPGVDLHVVAFSKFCKTLGRRL